MRIPRLLVPCLLAALLAACSSAPKAPAWSLLPQPANPQPAAEGAVTVANGDTVALVGTDAAHATGMVQHFIARAAKERGLKLASATQAEHARIVFELDPKADIDSQAGYRIAIGNDQIHATARTLRGLFYASITTGQLLTPNATKGTVRVADGRIADAPRFAWRGLMLDSSRHFQSVADIKRLIDWMALHKLDVLHWHLTDDQGWRLQIKRYPELTGAASCRQAVGPDAALTGGPDQPYCGFYTQDQARDIVAYAAARFITVVPEIDVPGHSQATLHAYPLLGVTGKQPPVGTDWGVTPWLLAPNEQSVHFVENVLDEVMAIFPSKYIHIGGDEAYKVQWENSPDAQAQRKRLGLKDMDALQGWMIDQFGAYLEKHGRTMVGWDEILQGGQLPASAVVMSWRGVKGAIEAAAKGHDTLLSPSPQLYLDRVQSSAHDEPPGRPDVRSLKDIYTFNPTPDALTAEQSKHVLGLQATLFSEYMPTFARDQHAIFPRMAAWAEVAWSPAKAIDWKDFLARMPAELARYQALGIAYADSAWAPRFALDGAGDNIRVTLSNQTGQGQLHYTTDGSQPTAKAAVYSKPLALPREATTTLKVATFSTSGQPLAAVRTRTINAVALRTRNSDQLDTCSTKGGIALRLEDDRPLDGPRPVYKVDIANTCWQWADAPLDGIEQITLQIGNLPWNYALMQRGWDAVVARPDTDPAGHIEVHLDSCTGPLLARIALDQAATTQLPSTVTAPIEATKGTHNLCIFATGDPRQGSMWALGSIELQAAKP